jgi:hypothetical protein
MFDFVMKMFSDGDVAVSALGMEEIPNNRYTSARKYSMSDESSY